MYARLTCILALMACIGGCAHTQADPPKPDDLRRAAVDEAIRRGVAYLVKSQNADGSWGSATETNGYEVYAIVPGTHDALRIGTTALCVMALRQAGEKVAHDRGLDDLLHHGDARRDTPDMMYNLWAHIFATQVFAEEYKVTHDPRLEKAAAWQIDRLRRYETYIGGWNYYDFDIGTQSPAMGPTSFGTAAALVALKEAKDVGWTIPPQMAERALKRLREMRLPTGAYIYSYDHEYRPRSPSDRLRGSVGRIQPCNLALWLWGYGGIERPQVIEGLNVFAREHRYLDMGRQRPIPHEAWYQTAGYYYFYDHYYAARLCRKLGWEEGQKHWPAVLDGILPHQEPDGSWWDFPLWGYHKPYGTAFAVLALIQYRDALENRDGAAVPANAKLK